MSGYPMVADLKKKKKNRKNIFPVSERRRQSKRISQYHLHTTKAAQARKKKSQGDGAEGTWGRKFKV